MTATTSPSIVILGAGFAGVGVAQELARLLAGEASCDITLVDQNNFSLFTPMLTEVAGGEVDSRDVVAAVRHLSPRVRFEQGRVDRIGVRDGGGGMVTLTVGVAEPRIPETTRTLEADQLVIALGSVTNYHGIQGLQQHSVAMKSVGDAATIRNRALALLERADVESSAEARRALLTFVVGGGGFSGVETMAALNGLLLDACADFDRVRPDDIRTLIVEPGNRLLPELSAGLATYTRHELEKRGVEVVLGTKITGAAEDHITVDPPLDGNARVDTHMLIWTASVKPSPVIDTLDVKRGHHGGIVVDSCCRVPGHPGLWALGDCAEIPKPGAQGTYTPTAQNATREGPLVARNIVAAMRGQPPQPFDYTPIGELAIVGKRAGVASVYGMHVSGFAAWAMWRAIYLAKMPSMRQRVRVGIDWLLDLAFDREIAELPFGREPNSAEQ